MNSEQDIASAGIASGLTDQPIGPSHFNVTGLRFHPSLGFGGQTEAMARQASDR